LAQVEETVVGEMKNKTLEICVGAFLEKIKLTPCFFRNTKTKYKIQKH